MGLDIYLYEKAQQTASDAHSKAWDEIYESDRWDAMTEVEQSAWRSENPWPEGHTTVNSERFPDHLFDRRYLRSSYNGGGFNRAVPEMTGSDHDLHWIFEPVRGGQTSTRSSSRPGPSRRCGSVASGHSRSAWNCARATGCA